MVNAGQSQQYSGRPHQWRCGGRRSLITAREHRQLIRMVRDNRFFLAPRLPVVRIRRFRRRLSVGSIVNRPLAAGYWSRRPARCPNLTLDHRGRRWCSGELTESEPQALCPQWWVSLHSVWSCSCAPQTGMIDACIQPTNGNHGPHSWFRVPSAMVEGMKWWCWMEPSTDNATSGFVAIVCFLGRRTFFNELCEGPGQCHTSHSICHYCFSGTTWCRGALLAARGGHTRY